MSAEDGASANAARRRRPRGRSRGLLVLALLAAPLVGLEIALRVLDAFPVDAGAATPAQAEFYAARMFTSLGGARPGYVNRPLARCTAGGLEYTHDVRGRRILEGAPDDDGRPALVFLGDSTTYGWGVAAQDSLPAATAAAMSLDLRPLNLGVNGYGTEQEAALYEHERAFFGPEVAAVVLVFYPNDTVPYDFRWDARSAALYVDVLPLPAAWKGVLWRSVLYRGVVSFHTEHLKTGARLAPGTPEGVAASLAGLQRLASALRADGRRLVVAHLPAMLTLDPYPFEETVARVAAECAALGVPFVDLLPAFLAHREAEITAYEARGGAPLDVEQRRRYLARFWVDDQGRDQHLNAAGNHVAGKALAHALDELLGTEGR